MWWTIVIAYLSVFVGLGIRFGPRMALGLVVPATWLLPSWFMLPIADGARDSLVGSGVDVKVAVGTGCLLLYCFMPGRTFPMRLIATDLAMLGLIGVHLASDLINTGIDGMALGRAYAEWYLPYVSGRLCITSREDLRILWLVPAVLAVVFAITTVFESIFDIQFFEIGFGARPVEGSSRNLQRWGIQRAYGPTMHAIYFGVVQLLLLGWASFASVQALRRRAPALWAFSPLLVMFGIAGSASRGPILGILIAAVGLLFFKVRRSRIPLVIAFSALAAFTVTNLESIIIELEKWSGEATSEIVIKGEERLQSSVRSRINSLEVNRIALRRSGLLGFGTQAVSGFPINVPLGPLEAEAFKKVWSVDNTYLLLTLRFGYLGLACFLGALLLGIVNFVRVADGHQGESAGWLSVCVGSCYMATLLVLATVWMPHEIGFPLIWTVGLSSGLWLAHKSGELARKPRRRRGLPGSSDRHQHPVEH